MSGLVSKEAVRPRPRPIRNEPFRTNTVELCPVDYANSQSVSQPVTAHSTSMTRHACTELDEKKEGVQCG